ncbi:MAG: GWxTD domain-containing protein [Candidatus Aminicenantes bacterium]|nr:GWxTD domain-containing protein [Candidatus Aminicenantes bacterium]
MKTGQKYFIAAASLLLVLLSFSCRLYNLERQLEPESAEFLSLVRYIITPQERKIFLELPAAEREAFIEEFWQRRDPDPDTPDNEFKIEFLSRIERANEIFHGEGRAGWLTDRGRIFVLFGPPMDRIRNPSGYEISARCGELWYYGDFPVVFVDVYCTGEYRLVTYDLSTLQDRNLSYMQALNKAEARSRRTFTQEKSLFDFNWSLKKTLVTAERLEALVTVEIPYDVIWFKSVGDRLETTLDCELSLKDSEKKTVWELKDSLLISLPEVELKDKKNARHRWEIPLVADKDLDRLARGKNTLHIKLVNRTGNEELRKTMDF